LIARAERAYQNLLTCKFSAVYLKSFASYFADELYQLCWAFVCLKYLVFYRQKPRVIFLKYIFEFVFNTARSSTNSMAGGSSMEKALNQILFLSLM